MDWFVARAFMFGSGEGNAADFRVDISRVIQSIEVLLHRHYVMTLHFAPVRTSASSLQMLEPACSRLWIVRNEMPGPFVPSNATGSPEPCSEHQWQL
jgi:hypothetical protein